MVWQAIAVAACIRDSWPVLILAPSSLRLHWASVSAHLHVQALGNFFVLFFGGKCLYFCCHADDSTMAEYSFIRYSCMLSQFLFKFLCQFYDVGGKQMKTRKDPTNICRLFSPNLVCQTDVDSQYYPQIERVVFILMVFSTSSPMIWQQNQKMC